VTQASQGQSEQVLGILCELKSKPVGYFLPRYTEEHAGVTAVDWHLATT
jgi:hypothetical protein